MVAFLVLLIAVFTRFVPHLMHGVGLGFTAVGGGLLFFGSRRPRWQAVIAMAVLACADYVLTTKVYGYSFHMRGYLVTWAWYGAVCLIGSALLRKVTALRVVAGVFASATSFFLLSNFVVWVGSTHTYAHNLAGLGLCYAAAVPFYANDLVSTGITAGALFGLPVLAAMLVRSMRSTHEAV